MPSAVPASVVVLTSGAQGSSDTKIADDRVAHRENDVSRLMSRWTTPTACRVVERIGNLNHDSQSVIYPKLALAREAVAKRLALEIRHDVVRQVAHIAAAQQRNDQRMRQLVPRRRSRA